VVVSDIESTVRYCRKPTTVRISCCCVVEAGTRLARRDAPRASFRGLPICGADFPDKRNQVEGTADDTMPRRDIEETKTAEPLPSSPPRPPRPPRSPRLLYGHDRPGTSALFVSLMTAFHRPTATGTMRESTRFGATCSESISTRRHATTTAFEAFTSLTLIPPRSRNQSSVRSLLSREQMSHLGPCWNLPSPT